MNELSTASHHEAPEVVDHRQRLGVWLFIGGDLITTGALIFTYLYLRAVSTGGNWMAITGLPANGRSVDEVQAVLDAGGSMQRIVEAPLSASFSWIIALVMVVSAAVFWFGEAQLRATEGGRKAFVTLSTLAGLVAVAFIVLSILQLRQVPQYWRVEHDSSLWIYTTYGSCMLALGVSAVIHALILAFLAFGSATRAAVGVIGHDRWFQVRLIRYFWVWVALSTVILTAVVTTLNSN
jgi:heme/copper-type cytochrome/quinol oxidase subunit 3